MRKSSGFFGFALALCASLLCAVVADAASWNVQATTGHPANSTGLGNLFASDGQVCGVKGLADTTWWIPFQLSATGATYTGTQFTSVLSAFVPPVSTRMVSLRPDNAAFQIGTFQSGSAIGSVVVIADGTLFTQSAIHESACLQGIKLTY